VQAIDDAALRDCIPSAAKLHSEQRTARQYIAGFMPSLAFESA
jgi:hypothetical protein